MKHSKHIVKRLGKPLLQAKLSPFPLQKIRRMLPMQNLSLNTKLQQAPLQVDRKLSKSGVSRLKRGGK